MISETDTLGDMTRMRAAVENSDLDAIVVVSPENLRYVANVQFASQLKIRDRLTFIVWAKGRDPVMVVCVVWEALVRKGSWITDLRTYREFHDAPVDILAETLRELGLENGRIGYESEYLGGRYVDALTRQMPNIELAYCDELLARVRMFKTPAEITLLRDAYRGTASALERIFAGAKEGDTERDLSRRLADAILRSGADSTAAMVMGAGINTGLHTQASDYAIRSGDLMKSDCGGRYSGYFTNIGRTAKLGPLNEDDRSVWTRLREIQHALIEMLRPGCTGREVYEACERLHAERDLPFIFGHNGHSVGLMIHERPIIAPNEDIAYEAGMVSTVETRVRWPGRIGYHMEDLFLITEDGPELLSDTFDNEEILVV